MVTATHKAMKEGKVLMQPSGKPGKVITPPASTPQPEVNQIGSPDGDSE